MQNISHVDPPVNICCMFLNSFDKMYFFPLALFKLNACYFVRGSWKEGCSSLGAWRDFLMLVFSSYLQENWLCDCKMHEQQTFW